MHAKSYAVVTVAKAQWHDRTSQPPRLSPGTGRPAFTLVELLVVIAVISVLLALIAPAFTQVNTGRQMTLAAYNIEGALDNARAYAKANNTYTWVGFFEEDGSQGSANPAVAGKGRIVISTVASKDGTAMYPTNGEQTPLTGSNLTQIGNLLKIDNTDFLSDREQGDAPTPAPAVGTGYQVGNDGFNSHVSATDGNSATNQVTFNYPVTAANGAARYKFVKVIQFGPLGDATKIVEPPVPLMEVGLRPAHGATPDANSKNDVAVQVTGIGGAVQIYRP